MYRIKFKVTFKLGYGPDLNPNPEFFFGSNVWLQPTMVSLLFMLNEIEIDNFIFLIKVKLVV